MYRARVIRIPEVFARSTIEREGESGVAWLAELPRTVQQLLPRWDCEQDGEITHGAVGIIVPVRRGADGVAVLKVSFPHPGNVHEPDAFAAWQGRGGVLLYERDDDRFAMLLEKARDSTLADIADGDEVMTVAGRITRRLAIPAPPVLPRLAAWADEWAEQLAKDAAELAHSLSREVVDAAAATIRELAVDQPDTLIHGDLHARNILRANREPWLAIDPKGYVGDPAYDGGTMIKTYAVRLIDADEPREGLRRALDVFSTAAELDHERVRRWAQLHAVQASFWGRRHGFEIARSGSGTDRLIAFAEQMAHWLTRKT